MTAPLSDGYQQLLDAGRTAAREAREVLAPAVRELDATDDAELAAVARQLSTAVGSLFEVETANAGGVHDGLARAMDTLSGALSQLRPEAKGGPVAFAAEVVARTLATLYPSRAELSRQLHGSDGGSPEPTTRRRARSEPPASPAAQERRRSRRFELDVGIGLQSETNFYAGFSGDISEGGLFVATYDVLPLGTPVTLSLVLPDGPQITVDGTVRWVREPMSFDSELHPGMGVAFEEVAEGDRRAIDRFLRLREPLFHED